MKRQQTLREEAFPDGGDGWRFAAFFMASNKE